MRLHEFQVYLKNKKIDAAVFVHPDTTLNYFVQRELTGGFLVVTPTSATLYVSPLDSVTSFEDITVETAKKKWLENLPRARKIGINDAVLSVAKYKALKKKKKKANVVDVGNHLQSLRQEKTTQELTYMATACKITSDAFAKLVEELPKGIKKGYLTTEQDVAFFLEQYMKQRDCSLAFPTIVAMGKNAAVPHHETGNTKLQRGFLLLDFGAKYEGYCADMSRTIFLGTPKKSEKRWYTLLQRSQKAALDEVKTGRSFTRLDKTARAKLGKSVKYFIHSLGHGIGLDVHEEPFFTSGKKIRKNVPFTVEPGIYIPEEFGIRIEDTVVITDKKKLEVLTTASKNFIAVKI